MARELGGSQISALLESVPGIANVLRSPVADALASMIRAGAGLGEFQLEHAKELIQYAERRGLIGSTEAEELLAEVTAVAGPRRRGSQAASRRIRKPQARAKSKGRIPGPAKAAPRAAKPVKGRPVKKAAKRH